MTNPKQTPEIVDEAGVPASQQTGNLEAARIAKLQEAQAAASGKPAATAKHETLAEQVEEVKEAVGKKLKHK